MAGVWWTKSAAADARPNRAPWRGDRTMVPARVPSPTDIIPARHTGVDRGPCRAAHRGLLMRRAIRSRVLAFATLSIALVIAACNTGAAITGAAVTSAPARMPAGVPAPVNASFAGDSTGYDNGAQVLAFSTQLGPTDATSAYATTLVAAGY